MPKKGTKKAKEPSFYTDIESCTPFGFMANDILKAPLGIQITILGVKKSADGTAQMWAEFPGGFQCPLRPKNAMEFEKQGYFKAHEGVHILRDNELFQTKRQALLDSINQEPKKEKKKEKKAEKKK